VLIICLTWVTYKTMFFPFPGPEWWKRDPRNRHSLRGES
jgi:hypothetical protein